MSITVPTTKINDETWLILKSCLGEKVVFRAHSIKHKGRVGEPSGHRVDEAHAEGGVKCKSKYYDISQLVC